MNIICPVRYVNCGYLEHGKPNHCKETLSSPPTSCFMDQLSMHLSIVLAYIHLDDTLIMTMQLHCCFIIYSQFYSNIWIAKRGQYRIFPNLNMHEQNQRGEGLQHYNYDCLMFGFAYTMSGEAESRIVKPIFNNFGSSHY